MRTVKIDVARMEFKKGGITCLSIDFPGVLTVPFLMLI